MLLVLAIVTMAGCVKNLQETVGLVEPAVVHEDALLGPGFRSILVEIDYVAGREPSPIAMDALEATLADITGKSVHIQTARIDAQQGPYTCDGLMRIHEATFDNAGGDHNNGQSVTLHVLYLDGKSESRNGAEFQGVYCTVQELSGDTVIGEDAVITLLPDYWNDLPDLPLSPLGQDSDFEGRYERAVLVHEAGHALGLVGEIPEVVARQDPDSPGHSDDPGSVMHSGEVPLDEDALIALRERGYDPVWQFDEDDLADLAAYKAVLDAA